MSSGTGQIPNGWGITSLERVCEILDSIRIPINAKERNDRIANNKPSELYPYYGATGKVGTIDGYLFEGEHLLLGEDGAPFLDHTKDTAYLASGKFWVNNHAHILKAYISNKYLCHYLNQFDFTKSVTGTTRLKLNQASLKEIPVWFAPENEQHRIVAKIEELFSELDKGIESLKTVREQLKVYRQALLKHAFEGKLTEQWRQDNADKLETADQLLERIKQEREARYQQQLEEWEAAVKQWEADGKEGKKPRRPASFKELPPLAETELDALPALPETWTYHRLAEISQIGSGMSVSKSRKLGKPVEVPYLRVANVQRGGLVLDEVKTMLIEEEKLKDHLLEKWDVLFNEGGDRDKLGRGWVWESQIGQCITQNHVFRATTYLGGEVHSKFVSHWGNTHGQDYFDKGGKQTTNLASINKTVLSMFPVPMPPVEEQEQIITLLEEKMSTLDSFESDIDKSLRMSESLRQSILKKAFSGQLVPQDPSDEPASVLLERIAKEKEEAAARAKKAKAAKKKPKTTKTARRKARS